MSEYKVSSLLKMMFEYDMWIQLLEKAIEKNLNKQMIKKLIQAEEREKLFVMILNGKHKIFPPRIAKIPKDDGKFREVYVNRDLDRIMLCLINDCLCKLFAHMIHPSCKSYQKGLGTQKVVKQIAKDITPYKDKHILIGYKSDFSKYFDTVSIECINKVFDDLEAQLGFDKHSEPVINLLRDYYSQNYYFDCDGNVCERYQGLKQGCAVASFLANVCLYELDEFMSNKYHIYYRYSDDLVVIDKDTSEALGDINRICNKHNVVLNPKKVEALYGDQWFKFLGFNIKGDLITLSKNRIKKFQHEVERLTIKRKKCSENQAKKNAIRFMYKGEHSWARSCLPAMNVKADIDELDKFVRDCIKACGTQKKRIGGLGVCFDRGDYTVVRGKGRNVSANGKGVEIEGYLTIGCMKNIIDISTDLFDLMAEML